MTNKRLKTSKQLVHTGKHIESEKLHICQFVAYFGHEPNTEEYQQT
jgi:hypothetical protein